MKKRIFWIILILLLIPLTASSERVRIIGGGGGGAPTDADYLVGTANGTLSAEIVVGTTPGGSLGGTWASPTIDDLFVKNNAADSMTGRLTARGFTSGVNDTGYDIHFYGATGGREFFIDESADKMIVDLASEFGDRTNKVVISGAGALSYEGSAKPTYSIYLKPTQAFLPASGSATLSKVTGNITYMVLDFDASSDERACWNILIPDSYAGGDATIEIYWISNAAVAGDCRWDVEYLSTGNSDPVDTAPTNVAMTVSTTDGTAKNKNTATGTLTTPFTAGDEVNFQIIRDVDQADDLVNDARLLGVKISFSVGN